MGVGDEDVGNRSVAGGGEDRIEMGGVVRAGVDDGERVAADEVGTGAVKGEGRGVRREHPAHQRRQHDGRTIDGVIVAVDGDGNGHPRSLAEAGPKRQSPCASIKKSLWRR